MATEFQPNSDQREALDKIEMWLGDPNLRQTFSLGGLAGTGKSSLIPSILEITGRIGIGVTIGTPTGKAACVVNRKLGRDLAKTIHQIAYRPISQRTVANKTDHLGREVIEPVFEENEFRTDLFIIDEASMVGPSTYERLLQSDALFLFIGDHGQLPPVQSEEISPSLQDRDHTLTEIVRQAEDNPIRQLAYDVRQGGVLNPYNCNPLIAQHQVRSTQEIAEQCHQDDVTFIVAATNKVRAAMNDHFRKLLGFDGRPYMIGEKIIVTNNSYAYQVFNGETFVVTKVHSRSDRHKEGLEIVCDLKDENTGREIKYITLGHQWRTAIAMEEGVVGSDFGYCLTCHKAQGSEAERVAVINEPIGWMKQHAPAWRYTAVTRAKEQLSVYTMVA